MLQAFVLALQILPLSDSVRSAELRQKAMIDQAREHEREASERAAARQRQFELKFNRLVDAVKRLSEQYNSGNGHTWPSREAAKLRDAMKDLQTVESSLRFGRESDSKSCQSPTAIRP